MFCMKSLNIVLVFCILKILLNIPDICEFYTYFLSIFFVHSQRQEKSKYIYIHEFSLPNACLEHSDF